MSSMVERIEEELKTAMKAQDKEKTGTLRMVKAALHNRKIEKRADLTDEEAVSVLVSMVKQRKDSIEQFEAGGRNDLADKEKAEIAVIQLYLPEQLDEEAVAALVKEAVEASGAKSQKEMGKVMALLMPKVKGKADGKLVNNLVRSMLEG